MDLFFKDIIELTKPCKAELHISYDVGLFYFMNITLDEGVLLQVSPFSSDLKHKITFRILPPNQDELEIEFIDKKEQYYDGYGIDIDAGELKNDFNIKEKFDVSSIDFTNKEDHSIFLHLFFENKVPQHIKIDSTLLEKLNERMDDFEKQLITSNELMNECLDLLNSKL